MQAPGNRSPQPRREFFRRAMERTGTDMKKLFLILLASFFIVAGQNTARAAGESAIKVYGATFPSSFAIYVLDPDILAGWNGPLRDYEKKFIPAKYHNLPVLGGWYGTGMIPDKEVLMRARFDRALVLTSDDKKNEEALPELQKLGFDIVALPNVGMAENVEMFRAMGREFGREARGEALAAYGEAALKRVAASLRNLPREEYRRVYMAQDMDGLTTSCSGSSRSEALLLAGGINVHECPKGVGESVSKISFEQIMYYDPDVIFINHPGFMRQYPKDKKWHGLRAAREGQVYFVPHEPFSWLDRPASFMRFMGVQWLAAKLHPDKFKIDLEAETANFLKLFFRLELSGGEIKSILKQ